MTWLTVDVLYELPLATTRSAIGTHPFLVLSPLLCPCLRTPRAPVSTKQQRCNSRATGMLLDQFS